MDKPIAAPQWWVRSVIMTLDIKCHIIYRRKKFIDRSVNRENTMKPTAALLTVAVLALTCVGCAGGVSTELARAGQVGKSYSSLAPSMEPVGSGGRVFIYRTKDSMRTSVAIGFGVHKTYETFAIDDVVYNIPWEVVTYVDVPSGPHEVSANDIVYSKGALGLGTGFRRGSEKLRLDLSSGETVYVRLDYVD